MREGLRASLFERFAGAGVPLVMLLSCKDPGPIATQTAPSSSASGSAPAPSAMQPSGAASAPAPQLPKEPAWAASVLTFGGEGPEPGKFENPRAITVAGDGSIFVSDYEDGRVQKFDAAGKYLTQILVPPSGRDGARKIIDITADSAGYVYVCRQGDVLQYRVTDGGLVHTIKGDYPDTWYDGGVDVDRSGRIYAITKKPGPRDESSDTLDLLIFSSSWKQLSRVKDIDANTLTVASDGDVYLPRRYKDRIDVLGADGKLRMQLDSRAANPSALRTNRAVAVDEKGHIFVENFRDAHVLDLGGRHIGKLTIPPLADFTLDTQGDLYVVHHDETIVKYKLNLPSGPAAP